MNYKFKGTVSQGEFHPDNPQYYASLARYNGKTVYLTVEPFSPRRSCQENSYYWAVVIEILSGFTGYTADEVHQCLKWKFLRVNKESKLETVKSTANLTVKEFEDYLENIRRWASADLGVFIPQPHENIQPV